MTNKKPMLILLATGTAGGRDIFISKIKKNQLLSDNKILQIVTNDYVTVRVKEESKIGEIVFGFEGTGRFEWGGVAGGVGLNSRQKKEINENLQVHLKIEHDWAMPENVNIQALKQKIEKELDEQQGNNRIIIVEGMHSLQFKDIRELADLKIWIQNDDDLRLIQKITRSPYYKKMTGGDLEDTRDFGGTFSSFPFAFKCWVDGNKPSEKTHVFPTKKYADLIVFSNDWSELDKGVEKVASFINLYSKNVEEFKKQLAEEKKQRIESEIIKLKEQVQIKEVELSQLVSEQNTNHQQQVIVQQLPNK